MCTNDPVKLFKIRSHAYASIKITGFGGGTINKGEHIRYRGSCGLNLGPHSELDC